jgi:23S rRNA (guanosine2251-2'-O)-methyltransferase
MAGNSSRKGAVRKGKKGALGGSGGQGKQRLEGRGPTPRAEDRPKHPAGRRAAAVARREAKPVRGGPRSRTTGDAPDLLLGRNPVFEALRAEIPATALYLAVGLDSDERVTDSVRLAADRGISLLEITRAELDRMTGGLLHQGIALQVPPYRYRELPDLFDVVDESREAGLLVALDGVTDPRNLGAVIRSSVAFGAHGVIIPERRAAGVTPTAWRTSAGTAARMPVAQITNLVRALKECQHEGYTIIGLDADGDTELDDLDFALDPIVLVVGSEGRGLSRLVSETCDVRVSIPMAAAAESLNASVAAAVTLAEIARRRRRALTS